MHNLWADCEAEPADSNRISETRTPLPVVRARDWTTQLSGESRFVNCGAMMNSREVRLATVSAVAG